MFIQEPHNPNLLHLIRDNSGLAIEELKRVYEEKYAYGAALPGFLFNDDLKRLREMGLVSIKNYKVWYMGTTTQ